MCGMVWQGILYYLNFIIFLEGRKSCSDSSLLQRRERRQKDQVICPKLHRYEGAWIPILEPKSKAIPHPELSPPKYTHHWYNGVTLEL